MIATSEPCGACECCKTGKRCARVLFLSPADAAALARVNAIVGSPSGRTIQFRPANGSARKSEPQEPTTAVRCPRCGEDYELFVYVVNTLKLRGHPAPPCEGCRYGNERADLR